MKRYISNYTILGNGEEVINHITTVDNDGKLISILPFDRELGNTVYVPVPLCVTATSSLRKVEKAFLAATSREHFKTLLSEAKITSPEAGTNTSVLSLNFNTKILTKL